MSQGWWVIALNLYFGNFTSRTQVKCADPPLFRELDPPYGIVRHSLSVNGYFVLSYSSIST